MKPLIHIHILIILLPILNAEWVLMVSQFHQTRFTDTTGWTNANEIRNCQQDMGPSLIVLGKNNKIVTKTLTNLPPHHTLKFIVDVYYMNNYEGEYGRVVIDGQIFCSREYNGLVGSANKNLCLSNNGVETFTNTIITPHSATTAVIELQTNLDYLYSDESYSFRNVQIYIDKCNDLCKACSSTDVCTQCYQGIVGTDNKCNKCAGNQVLYHNLGCIDYCPSGYQADSQRVCKINPLYMAGFNAQDDDLVVKLLSDPKIQDNGLLQMNCGSIQYSGPFYGNQGLSITITLDNTSKFVKLVFYYGISMGTDSIRLVVLQGNTLYGSVYLQDNTITSNGVIIRSINENPCSSLSKLLCIEVTMPLVTSNVNINIVGIIIDNQIDKFWIIKIEQIESIVCAANCLICLNRVSCRQCQSAYLLQNGKCYNNCQGDATQSGNTCTPSTDNIQYSKYLVQLFYDIDNTSDEVANNAFDIQSTPTPCSSRKGPMYSYFNEKRVFGGSLVWNTGRFKKEYTINEPHYAVTVKAKFILGEGYSGTKRLDITPLSFVSSKSVTTEQLQGTLSLDIIYIYDQYVTQSTSTLGVEIICSIPCNTYEFCAIADYTIIIHQCYPLCKVCTGNLKTQCSEWLTNVDNATGDSCNIGYYYSDGQCLSCDTQLGCEQCDNPYTCLICKSSYLIDSGYCLCSSPKIQTYLGCEQCNTTCLTCYGVQASECLTCNSVVFRTLSNGKCLCLTGYYDLNGFCQPCYFLCKQCIGPFNGQCVECTYNYVNNGYCYCQSQHQYPDIIVAQCLGIDIQYIQECHVSCKTCYGGLINNCLECEYGVFRTFTNSQCNCMNGYYPAQSSDIYCTECQLNDIQACFNNCGDGIIQWNEQCDDGNNIQYDGCYQCQYQCTLDCIVCYYGICLECSAGLITSGSYFCNSICGNGIITQNEECEDMNQIQYDGCHQCMYQCQPSCLHCKFGICLTCKDGWELVEINSLNKTIYKCLQCGDGYTISLFEQCDDGNNTIRDGCSNCIINKDYFCSTDALQLSQCYKCPTNCSICHQVNNIGECTECEQGYFIKDGQCYNCSTKCISCNQTPNSCIVCKNPDLECKTCSDYSGLYEAEIIGVCTSHCGDGIVAQNEQCDDGNTSNGDGCNNICQIESQFQCTLLGQDTYCNPITQIEIDLELVNKLNQKQQQISVTFSQQLIAYQLDVQKVFQCVIDGLDPSEYLIEIITNNEQGPMEQSFEFRIIITFYTSMLEGTLKVSVNDDVFTDSLGYPINSLSSTIGLIPVYILSPGAEQTVEYISNLNTIALYCILALLGIQIVTGGISSVFNSLDLLQQLSYLKYINILIPAMLRDYLEVFDLISFNFVLEYDIIDQLVLFRQQDTQDMFGNYAQTANFFTNILSMILVVLLTYSRCIICNILLKIDHHYDFYFDWPPTIKKYVQKILLFAVKFKNRTELHEIFISGIYDISSAALIQIKYGVTLTVLDKLQYYTSVCTLSWQIGLITNITIINLHPQTQQRISVCKMNYWSQQYTSMLMIKKCMFMCSLVLLQSVPVIQVLVILFTAFLFGIYVWLAMPMRRKVENYQLLLTEFTIGYSMLYFFFVKIQLFSSQIYIVMAWMNIILLSILILFQAFTNILLSLPQLKRLLRQLWIDIKFCLK